MQREEKSMNVVVPVFLVLCTLSSVLLAGLFQPAETFAAERAARFQSAEAFPAERAAGVHPAEALPAQRAVEENGLRLYEALTDHFTAD
jgi:hypothetical protein